MAVTKVTSMSQFDKIISENEKVFVDFSAVWCGPCKMVSPIIHDIAEEMKDVKFIDVDVDANQDIAERFAIMSIPTMLVFENKEQVKSHIGFASKDMLLNLIKK
ncbi:thioredoxin [Spiroplasma sp. TIUS-1]|uniref:thioredoxin n=1 Tax=Spiroplasma sp. TIUS-1 TaxID=216963 RepID=UPI001396DB2A|nr:thioredoxin [Spiroplasma sp. TIUS-1]QHX35664.1 thioredoxin [Spiroplasma sp. TIUS-1]